MFVQGSELHTYSTHEVFQGQKLTGPEFLIRAGKAQLRAALPRVDASRGAYSQSSSLMKCYMLSMEKQEKSENRDALQGEPAGLDQPRSKRPLCCFDHCSRWPAGCRLESDTVLRRRRRAETSRARGQKSRGPPASEEKFPGTSCSHDPKQA